VKKITVTMLVFGVRSSNGDMHAGLLMSNLLEKPC